MFSIDIDIDIAVALSSTFRLYFTRQTCTFFDIFVLFHPFPHFVFIHSMVFVSLWLNVADNIISKFSVNFVVNRWLCWFVMWYRRMMSVQLLCLNSSPERYCKCLWWWPLAMYAKCSFCQQNMWMYQFALPLVAHLSPLISVLERENLYEQCKWYTIKFIVYISIDFRMVPKGRNRMAMIFVYLPCRKTWTFICVWLPPAGAHV